MLKKLVSLVFSEVGVIVLTFAVPLVSIIIFLLASRAELSYMQISFLFCIECIIILMANIYRAGNEKSFSVSVAMLMLLTILAAAGVIIPLFIEQESSEPLYDIFVKQFAVIVAWAWCGLILNLAVKAERLHEIKATVQDMFFTLLVCLLFRSNKKSIIE